MRQIPHTQIPKATLYTVTHQTVCVHSVSAALHSVEVTAHVVYSTRLQPRAKDPAIQAQLRLGSFWDQRAEDRGVRQIRAVCLWVE